MSSSPECLRSGQISEADLSSRLPGNDGSVRYRVCGKTIAFIGPLDDATKDKLRLLLFRLDEDRALYNGRVQR